MRLLRSSAVSSWLIGLSSSIALSLLPSCNLGDRGDGVGEPDPAKMQPADPKPKVDPEPAKPPSRLTGKVVAPEGTIPIAGALVYVSPTPPTAIPDGVYCDKCIHLQDGTPFTTTKADGTFALDANAGSGFLVVQKGAFRRVRPITLTSGAQPVPLAMTTLPPIMDKANGDDVPKIAVMLGAWDPIELVLAKMGMKATITKDLLGKAQVLGKDAPSFAIYGVHGLFEMSPYPSPVKLITDPAEISKYHIVFIPCSGGTNNENPEGPKCTGVYNYDPKVKSTLNEFVRKGGRLYVSDWSYEYVRQVFPGFVSWRGETATIGSACGGGGGEQSVLKTDSGLDAWLTGQGQLLSAVKDAWTAIASVKSNMGPDPDGKMVNITPKVWVEATGGPVTTSLQHGCGRVLYTTYHTQPTSQTNNALEPQALALLYLILEVGVCIDPIIIG
jgi:hypothetical protein